MECASVLADSAGGELILGWRKSALFYKSSLFERLQDASSDFCKTLLADSRQPRSQPPTKPQPEPMHTPRLVIQGGWVGWLSRLGVQVGRFRVAARGLDEASALRWMPGWKG